MALSNLASPGDLEARGIIAEDESLVVLLASASAAIRDAAGCSITTTTGTVALFAPSSLSLVLPGYAVTEVTEATIDEVAVTDFTRVGPVLMRAGGWGCYGGIPSVVAVTYTQGLTKAPADIVDLCCSLVAAGVKSLEDGYDPHRGVSSERIDDYQRSFTRGDDEVVTPMELPESTRQWLRQRFGASVAVTGALA